MRPLAGSEAFQPRSRKPSVAEPPLPLPDVRSSSPVAFFLRRGSQGSEATRAADVTRGQDASPVQSLTETLESLPQSASTVVAKKDTDEAAQSPRRRSTLKAKGSTISQRSPSVKGHAQSSQQEALTPLLIPSETSSLPSSPKSTSTRSLRPSEAGSTAEENGSQAILSSGDEEPEPELSLQLAEPAPQLIMPSIKMPSRRPFTERGKRMGNFKISIAGSRGTGKTSLIKSIVQTCEDIVHVDPLPVDTSRPRRPYSKGKQPIRNVDHPRISEINASTRSYPTWWSEIEESKILRRRRSMGDAVLDRNLCFVDTESGEGCNHISEHMVLQLQKALRPPTTSNHDLAALLSGAGGSQVDVVLYLLSEGTLESDISNMKALSELSNVIPLISKADLLSSEQIETLKVEVRTKFDITTLPKLPAFGRSDPPKVTEEVSAPYTVSSAIGPDHETMDASLLMSPDYVQPLMPSELVLLVQQIFETEVMSYLRHFAAKKLIAWGANHPQSTQSTKPASPPLSFSPRPSSLASPLHCALSNSGVLVPFTSDLSLTPSSNNQAMIRLAEHTQQEERLAQVRLSQWASDLQSSLQRERERFEKLARGDRAIWLVEKMSEEARDGQLSVLDHSGALVRAGTRDEAARSWTSPMKYSTHDPLGLLRWSDSLKTRGWIALQVVGSFGMIGGLAFWLAKTWGLTSAITEWTQGWGLNCSSFQLGLGE